MTKSPRRKLKVFQAQFGFYDTVVAASSRVSALRAWGTHQDLFASGQAREIDDPAAMAAARAHPETPLKRAIGSSDAFELEPANLPDVPDAPKRNAPKRAEKPKAAQPSKALADRGPLDAAEAALRKLDESRKREEADFRRLADELKTRQSTAQAAYVENRKAATSAVVAARQVYRKAGGVD